MWQDIVIMAGLFVFAVALVPTVRSKDQKPALSTCAISAVVQTVFVVAMATLNMWAATAGNATCALLWWVLLVQTALRYLRQRKARKAVADFKERYAQLPPETRSRIDDIVKRFRKNPSDLTDPKQREQFVDAGVNFVMGGDDVPDCLLDAQELEKRHNRELDLRQAKADANHGSDYPHKLTPSELEKRQTKTKAERVETLHREKDKAIDGQEYERAADIVDEIRAVEKANYTLTPKFDQARKAAEVRAKISDKEWYVEVDGFCVRDGDNGFVSWDCKGYDDSENNPYRPQIMDFDAHEFIAKAKNLSWPWLMAAVELAEACVEYHATAKTVDQRKGYLAQYEALR